MKLNHYIVINYYKSCEFNTPKIRKCSPEDSIQEDRSYDTKCLLNFLWDDSSSFSLQRIPKEIHFTIHSLKTETQNLNNRSPSKNPLIYYSGRHLCAVLQVTLFTTTRTHKRDRICVAQSKMVFSLALFCSKQRSVPESLMKLCEHTFVKEKK